MSEWKECKLEDLITLQRGHDLPKSKMQIGEIPVAGSNGIIGFHNVATTKAIGITIGRSGNLGNAYLYKRDFWAHNTTLYVKDFKGNDEVFVYYFLKNIDFKSFNVGSAVPTLNRNHIHPLLIKLPPLLEQKAIAEVLSSLDDKIDLLHRQNLTLEQMAETLFRQWFVEEANTSNDESLKDYVESANTGLDAIKRAPIVAEDTGIKCLRIQDVSQSKKYDNWGFSKVEKRNFIKFQLKKDDIIIARTGATVGVNLFIMKDLESVFNNGLIRIRANKNKVYPTLINYLIKTKDFAGHIESISGGTATQPNIQIGDLLSYCISFPPKEEQDKIIDHFNSIDDKILYNKNQISTLEEIRDTLLPKLISGEVRVDT